jgi:DNA-directed RNA polymerase subunit D
MESTCVHKHLHKGRLIIMDIQIVEKTDFTMRLIIRGVKAPFVNALRRIMLSEVPAMAIEDVVIIENSSVIHDEILANRLGFIPLKTDLDSYNLPEECPCKSEFGCNLCRVALTLEAEATDEITAVYSGDLQSENPDIAPTPENKIGGVRSTGEGGGSLEMATSFHMRLRVCASNRNQQRT